MLPTMQCDNPSTVIHLLLRFLTDKNHERKKTKNTQTKKQHALIPNHCGGEIHDKQGCGWHLTSVKVSSLFPMRLVWQENAY